MSVLILELSGIVGDEITTTKIGERITAAGEQIDELHVEINSPGGNYFEGIAIYNKLQDFKGKVVVDVVGEASSAANIIAMAADEGERIIRENAKMMAHFPWTGKRGNADDFQKTADELKQLNNDVMQIYLKRIKLNKSELEQFLKEEKLMDAKEAVKLGFADRIEKSKSKVKDYGHDYTIQYGSIAAFSEKATFGDREPAQEPVIAQEKFTTKPWDGSKARFTIEQLLNAVAKAVAKWARDEAKQKDRDVIKTDLKLPFKEPDGTVNINGVRNALARLPQTQGLPNNVKESARTELQSLLNKFKERQAKGEFKEYLFNSKIELIIDEQIYPLTDQEVMMLERLKNMLKEIQDFLKAESIEDIMNKLKELKESKIDKGNNGEVVTLKNEYQCLKTESEATKRALEVVQNQLKVVNERHKKRESEQIDEQLNGLQEEGRITAAQAKSFKAVYDDSRERGIALITEAREWPQVYEPLLKPAGSGGEGIDADDPMTAYENEIKRVMKEKEVDYEAAAIEVASVKPELFEAYNKAVSS
ncbi:MAG: head maturation protease, ClpP-related [bacterium]